MILPPYKYSSLPKNKSTFTIFIFFPLYTVIFSAEQNTIKQTISETRELIKTPPRTSVIQNFKQMKKIFYILTILFVCSQSQAQIVKFYLEKDGAVTEIKPGETVNLTMNADSTLDGYVKAVIDYQAFKNNYNYEVLSVATTASSTSRCKDGDKYYKFTRRLNETAFAKQNANSKTIEVYLFINTPDKDDKYGIFRYKGGLSKFYNKTLYFNVFGRYIEEKRTSVQHGRVRYYYDYTAGERFVDGIGVNVKLTAKLNLVEIYKKRVYHSDSTDIIRKKLENELKILKKIRLYPTSNIFKYKHIVNVIDFITNEYISSIRYAKKMTEEEALKEFDILVNGYQYLFVSSLSKKKLKALNKEMKKAETLEDVIKLCEKYHKN